MFKSFFIAIISLLMLINPAWPSGNHTLGKLPNGKSINLDDYELVWSDEFDGDEIDRTKWRFDWWVTERKGGFWHEDMVSVSDGNLVISAEYKDEAMPNYYGNYIGTQAPAYRPGWYTGQIVSNGLYEQKYGYFEVRAILPEAPGLWSAFWMMNEGVFNIDGSGADGAEIDIFESLHNNEHRIGGDYVSSNVHFDGYGDAHQHYGLGKTMIRNNPYKEYNTYGLEWTEDEYIFYLNGVETGRTSFGVSQNPEYLLLSVEFAGENGEPSNDALHGVGSVKQAKANQWPAQFIVDYVRCYSHK